MLNALSNIMRRPITGSTLNNVLQWGVDYGIPLVGGGHNRAVFGVQASNGINYAIKVPIRLGGIDDNCIELLNSRYALSIYNIKNDSVAGRLAYADDATQANELIDNAGKPLVLIEEWIDPLHNDEENTSDSGIKAVYELINNYGAWKSLITHLDQWFYIADVDLKKPFNFGIRTTNSNQELVLLDHGMVLPRYEVSGSKYNPTVNPAPIQCPHCGAQNSLHYEIPRDLDLVMSNANLPIEKKLAELKSGFVNEKHLCEKCGNRTESVLLIKAAQKLFL